MSVARGGSRHGENFAGHPDHLRLLILPLRTGPGDDGIDGGRWQTYRRNTAGGPWVFVHEGARRDDDGGWYF